MTDSNPDPFEQGLQGLEADRRRREAVSTLAAQYLTGLLNTANKLGIPHDDATDYLLGVAAVHLGAIGVTPDPERQHTQERELLMDLTAVGDAAAVEVLLAHTGVEPLGEEEVGIVADKIAERAVVNQRNEAIIGEVYSLLAEMPELHESQNDRDVRALLTDLVSLCYQLRHNTEKADVELRRQNFIEKASHIIYVGGLNPALRRLVIALLSR